MTRLCRDSPVTCLLCSVEILCQSGIVEPGAMKRLKYGTPWEQLKANCELAALKDAEGCSHLVQILAVSDYWCPTDQQRYLYIATKYALARHPSYVAAPAYSQPCLLLEMDLPSHAMPLSLIDDQAIFAQ